MKNEKQSFFEKLAGVASYNETSAQILESEESSGNDAGYQPKEEQEEDWLNEINNHEGQLTVDVYQTPSYIVVQAPMAGVKPEDVDVSINNDMITIRGKRQQKSEIDGESYYYRELFWGPFSRSVLMPSEVDSNRTEASFKNGLLTVKMPKINKDGIKQVKIQAKEV